MSAGYLALGIAFALLVLLDWVIVRHSRWHWAVKCAATLSVIALALLTWRSYPTLLGWPTVAHLPERFTLVGAHIEEPNKTAQTQGAIFLWAKDLLAGVEDPPRAYQVPYSAGLHTRVVAATVKLRKGLPQLGERVSAQAAAGGYEPGADAVEFFDMPDPLFPER